MIYSLADYRQIFALTDEDLQKKILNFPAGISSVNAELYQLGQPIISGDPSYGLTEREMRQQVQKALSNHSGQEQQSAELFLSDYAVGKTQDRYRLINPPPFTHITETFELLLCTDFLFNVPVNSGSAQQLMNELCKLATEIRIFPLPEDQTVVAAELGPMMLAFQQRNFGVEVRAVNHPLNQQATAMLRVWARECYVV